MRKCKHCPRFTRSSDEVARVQGWRWYDGPTQGGGHLSDVVCPVCAGYAEPESEEWIVGCRTCDWESIADDADDRILTGKDAIATTRMHECEPDLWIRPPGSDVDYHPFAFDRDGELRPEHASKREPARA